MKSERWRKSCAATRSPSRADGPRKRPRALRQRTAPLLINSHATSSASLTDVAATSPFLAPVQTFSSTARPRQIDGCDRWLSLFWPDLLGSDTSAPAWQRSIVCQIQLLMRSVPWQGLDIIRAVASKARRRNSNDHPIREGSSAAEGCKSQSANQRGVRRNLAGRYESR